MPYSENLSVSVKSPDYDYSYQSNKKNIGYNNTHKGHDANNISSCIMFTVINVRKVTRFSSGK